MHTFSGAESVRFGWETFKKRPWFLAGATLLYMVLVGVVSAILVKLGGGNPVLALILTAIRIVFDLFAAMGFIAFSLKAHDDIEAASLKDFWHPQDFLKFLGAIVAQILVIVAGIILLVIPGIVLSVSLKFSPYFVVDRGAGPIESLFESARITRGKKWAVFQFLALLAVVVLAGVFALIVGVVAAVPVVSIATAHAYRTLSRA